MKNNNTISWRVAQLEANYIRHNEVLYGEHGILTNELPHIQKSLASMKTRINVATTINIGVLILVVVITRLFN